MIAGGLFLKKKEHHKKGTLKYRIVHFVLGFQKNSMQRFSVISLFLVVIKIILKALFSFIH